MAYRLLARNQPLSQQLALAVQGKLMKRQFVFFSGIATVICNARFNIEQSLLFLTNYSFLDFHLWFLCQWRFIVYSFSK